MDPADYRGHGCRAPFFYDRAAIGTPRFPSTMVVASNSRATSCWRRLAACQSASSTMRRCGTLVLIHWLTGFGRDTRLPVAGSILHDWSLEKKQALIRKAYEALPFGGALIVYDLDHRRRPSAQCLWIADEPEHADRNARGLRLHWRGLHRLA